MFASINRPGWRVDAVKHGAQGRVGVVLYSGAIIISLLAMQARAPQWLLMFCGGWTLFTLLNVTWQPLMAFQLALIWGGYAFLAPRDLPQHKFWKSKLWQSIQREGIILKGPAYPEPQSTPPGMPNYGQPETPPTESNSAAPAKNKKPRSLNKRIIAHIFIVILVINIFIHLIPFNYSSVVAADQIARSVGNTVGIYLISLFGLMFKPSKTFAVALIAILIAPIMILADRAHDPLAPPYFRELLYPNDDMALTAIANDADTTEQDAVEVTPPSTAIPVSTDDAGTNEGRSDYQRSLDAFIKSSPILTPDIYQTSDMPAVDAASAGEPSGATQE